MAVVILMLPGAGDPAHRGSGTSLTNGGAPLTYKLSLAPGGENATIELEGQPPVKAPVQRVYPSPPPRVSPSSLALLRSVPAAPPTGSAGPIPAATGNGASPYPPGPPRPRRPAPAPALAPLDPWAGDTTTMVDPRGPRAGRRAIPTTTHQLLPADQIDFSSANGAPIIE